MQVEESWCCHQEIQRLERKIGWGFLLEKVYQKLPPTGYVGVHIRLKDRPSFPCGDENGTVFKEVADRIVVGEPNVTSGFGGKMAVLIGGSASNTKKCFQSVANANWSITTVNDIVDGDVELLQLIDIIQLETETIYLLLDQILIALAERLVMDSAMDRSTFQTLIQRRHMLRGETVAMFENA
jgi:hypothetical protein